MTVTTTTLPLTSGIWTEDSDHSSADFTVRHLGLAKVRGSFEDLSVQLVVGEDLASSRVEATIELASVDTRSADRDTHLRSPDFFDVENNPHMTFRSTAITSNGDDYLLEGQLTLGGVTRDVSLDVEFFGTEVYPMDNSTRAGFSATTTISRRDFGVTFDIPMGGDKYAIGDKVSVELDIQLVAP